MHVLKSTLQNTLVRGIHIVHCREAAWQEYQHGPGAAKAGLLMENRGRLRELKRKAKVCPSPGCYWSAIQETPLQCLKESSAYELRLRVALTLRINTWTLC
eukprot:1158801-Pelagomonas_calceolata.AAC.8